MLEDALQNNNTTNIILHSHTMKGSAGNIGALKLQELAKTLEYNAKNYPNDELHSTYLLVEKESKILVQLFNNYLQKIPSNEKQTKISKKELENSLETLKKELTDATFINTEENILFHSYYNDKITEQLQTLKESIDNFLNDKALTIIDKLLEEIGNSDG